MLQKLRSALHAKRSGKEASIPDDKARPDTAFLCEEKIQIKAENLSPIHDTVRT
jgi:hypothetical protein